MKSEPICKLTNRIPGTRLLISSLPCLASRTHVESLGKHHHSASALEALPGKLDIERHSPSDSFTILGFWVLGLAVDISMSPTANL